MVLFQENWVKPSAGRKSKRTARIPGKGRRTSDLSCRGERVLKATKESGSRRPQRLRGNVESMMPFLGVGCLRRGWGRGESRLAGERGRLGPFRNRRTRGTK